MLCLVIVLWIVENLLNFSLLLTTNNSNEMYGDCKGRICSFLNIFLQETLFLVEVSVVFSAVVHDGEVQELFDEILYSCLSCWKM